LRLNFNKKTPKTSENHAEIYKVSKKIAIFASPNLLRHFWIARLYEKVYKDKIPKQ
jgi:hypothetical protein